MIDIFVTPNPIGISTSHLLSNIYVYKAPFYACAWMYGVCNCFNYMDYK